MSDIKSCKQTDCEVRLDGNCLEGLEIEECPHFYWAEAEESENEEVDNSVVIPTQSNKISLFRGTELSLTDMKYITHRYKCDLVVILGDLDCGKTTLLATIFDMFQIGGFKKYIFAGSLTQKGFEIRSHLSRVESGATVADTERTKALEFRLLHIAIQNEQGLLKHFLLSDISGETIKLARSSSTAMKEQLGAVKLADHVIYVIDGQKLSTRHRIATIMDAELFIQSCIDNGIFSRETILNILISKWDLLSKTDFDIDSTVVTKLNQRFAQSLKGINYKKIASRPHDESEEEVNLGFGVEDLIDDFMKGDIRKSEMPVSKISSQRQIDNYKVDSNGK